MTNGCKTWDSSNFSCLTIFNGWKWCVCIPAAIVRFFFFSFFSISWGKNEARYSLEQFIMLIWATKLTNYYMTIVSSLKFIGLNVSNCPFSLWVYQNIWSVKFQANYEIIYFMNCVHVFFQEISFVYYSIFASMWKHCDCELKLCKHETKLEKGETRINSNAL